MGAKTSQLQIRVSPGEKAALKGLAEEAGLSVSAYVLAKALPSDRLELERWLEELAVSESPGAGLSMLTERLRALPGDQFREAVTGPPPADLRGLLLGYAAAAIERESRWRNTDPPEWTTRVEPLEKPHFEWDLRALRPYLMRVAPPAFKRRRLFVLLRAAPDAGDTGRVASPDVGGWSPEASTDPDLTAWARKRWDLLSRALAQEEVAAELCVVGGAVMRLAFTADPRTRRPSSLFVPPGGVDRAADRVAERAGLPSDWLSAAVRKYVGTSGGSSGVYEGPNLRVFAAPADYVLAMKCASLAFAPAAFTESDIRYLLRFLEIRSVERVVGLVDRYLNARQRPDDLEDRLKAMLR